MNYNFDEQINRAGTSCVKYDLRKLFFGDEDVIPLWVADMDFATPPFILDAIRKRTEHPVLGYTFRSDEYYESIVNWVQRRHNWNLKREWICFSPGIVPAINLAVLALTKPGDRIIVQPPVYFPFFTAVKNNGRVLCHNQLKLVNGRYEMDYTNLEMHCREGAAMIIISNPHNPGGNAWQPAELKRLADICLKYNVLMVSDEIHCDLVNIGYKHTVLASLGKRIADNTITMIAPSKTFNLAGLSTASVVISNNKLRTIYNKLVQNLHVDMGNVFGSIASTAAYKYGEEWLAQLLQYINGNINYLQVFLKEYLPEVTMVKPEATYMAWLDFSAWQMGDKELAKFLLKEAGIGLNPGAQFGRGGQGFMRINLACPRSTLTTALNKLREASVKMKEATSRK